MDQEGILAASRQGRKGRHVAVCIAFVRNRRERVDVVVLDRAVRPLLELHVAVQEQHVLAVKLVLIAVALPSPLRRRIVRSDRRGPVRRARPTRFRTAENR